MDRFYIIPNSAKDPELTFSNRIIAYLEKHGARCHVQKITEKMEGPYHYTDPDGIPQDTQCIIVLGGDGTLLQAARDVWISLFLESIWELWDFLPRWIKIPCIRLWIGFCQMTMSWKIV